MKTRILVVDDSVVARRIISDILRSEDDFEVVGTAANGRIAMAKMPILSPDVVTLDVDMPEMDGLQVLAAVRSEFPNTKVVMVSNLTRRGAQTTVDALFLGASDYVTKATMSESPEQARLFMRDQLVPKIRAIASAGAGTGAPAMVAVPHRPAPPARIPAIAHLPRKARGRIKVVAIGASTGGPNALSTVLAPLPADFPVPILVVQHMPKDFTAYLAKRLDEQCRLKVTEARSGEKLLPGRVLIAPGDLHMEVRKPNDSFEVVLRRGALVNSCRPAVDVLFQSIAATYGGNALAVVLTGMGQDGFRGCEMLKELGAQVIAQDEASSVVWGMPGFVANAGLADAVLAVSKVNAEIVRRVGRTTP